MHTVISRDAHTKVDSTPLHMAAASERVCFTELLVRNSAAVNAKDMLKMTAWHRATEHHQQDAVELLIKYGADVHAFSKFDKSDFDIALEKNIPKILVILQEAMNSQVTANSKRATRVTNSMTVAIPFIFASGEVINLANLISSANTKTTSANSEDIIEGNSVHISVQELGNTSSRKSRKQNSTPYGLTAAQWSFTVGEELAEVDTIEITEREEEEINRMIRSGGTTESHPGVSMETVWS